MNIYNYENSPNNIDPIKYIFTQTNKNIIDIINKNIPASIIRLGGSDLDEIVNSEISFDNVRFNSLYELNGYFDKTNDKDIEKENFYKIKDLFIKSIQNSDLITIGGLYLLEYFGFVPNIKKNKDEKYNIFFSKYLPLVPICHWDFVNLDYEHNFFLNVFPYFENKKICIISSFVEDIKIQYLNKDNLFINKCYNNRVGYVYKDFKYPNFKSIEYINIPICYCKYNLKDKLQNKFNNSIELIEDLFSKINNTDSEIYLIGGGIYANILCNYIKNKGKIGINCGSAIQLFFGLLGNRFTYLISQNVTNDYWKYPDLTKCNLITSYTNMGGFITDGIGAYIIKT